MAGVPVIPVGSMFPQPSSEPGTGEPALTRQTTRPVFVLSAYTESFSVATNTRPSNTSGSA